MPRDESLTTPATRGRQAVPTLAGALLRCGLGFILLLGVAVLMAWWSVATS